MTAITLVYAVHLFVTRSIIAEKMQYVESANLSRFFIKVNQRLSSYYSQNELDAKLRIADYPMRFTGNSYLGYMILITTASFVVGMALAMARIIEWHYVPAITFVFWGIPRYIITKNFESNKTILRVKLMDFCARLEQGVAGGAQPITVFKKAAESDDLLGKEMQAVMASQKLNKSLHKAFVEHFVDILHIPEADEIGVMLRNSEERGTVLSEPLRDLNRDFRLRRQTELLLKASRLKPTVTIILTVSVLVATLIFIVGPILIETFQTIL